MNHELALKLTTWLSIHAPNKNWVHKINRWILKHAKHKSIYPRYSCNYAGDCGCSGKCFHYDEQQYLIGFRNWKHSTTNELHDKAYNELKRKWNEKNISR
jgi:hypothetical protein